jgi:cbb3-type cytochrome oxidase maturation protein
MSVIPILIVASLTMALLFLGAFIWSVRSGQFDDTTTPSMRVLADEPNLKKTAREAGDETAPDPAGGNAENIQAVNLDRKQLKAP